MCLTDVQQNSCCLNIVLLFIYFRIWSHEQTWHTHTFKTQEPTHAHMQSFSCEHHYWIGNVCMRVWMAEKGEWWKGRELIVMLRWIQMREASWILIRLPPLFLRSLRVKVLQRVHLSEPMGVSLGHPFKVKVPVFFPEEQLLKYFF